MILAVGGVHSPRRLLRLGVKSNLSAKVLAALDWQAAEREARPV